MKPIDERDWTPDQIRAREAVRALPAPPASPRFRSALKQQFISGAIPAGENRAAIGRVPRRSGFSRAARIGIAAVAAAAVLAIGIGLLNRGPAWRIAEPVAPGALLVDGEPVPSAAAGSPSPALRAGRRIAAAGPDAVTLACPGRLVLQIPAGGEITLPRPPGRWFAREVRTELKRGSIRIVSGPEFAGARLLVATAEAEVEVLGTTLAVTLIPEGTCICVLRGVVRASARHGGSAEVPAGMRCTIYPDGRPPLIEEILPMERETLQRFESL